MEFLRDIYEAINAIEVNTIGSIYKLLLSMLLGAVVGFERRRKGQTAGVRTYSLCFFPYTFHRNTWVSKTVTRAVSPLR